ncbi:hypothetical protein GCM10020256_02420 [Streptomyces thermocoprophilus]
MVEVRREPQVVFEEDAVRSDDEGLVSAGEDEGGPGLLGGDGGKVAGSLAAAGLGLQASYRLVEGGPAEFVEDAGAQGAAEERFQAQLGGLCHGARADPGGHGGEGAQPVQCRSGGGQAGGADEVVGGVLQPCAQHVGEDRMVGDPLGQRPVGPVGVEAAEGAVQHGAAAGVGGDGRQVPSARPGVGEPLGGRRGPRVLRCRAG